MLKYAPNMGPDKLEGRISSSRRGLYRRQLLGAVAGVVLGTILASLDQHLQVAVANAQSGRWSIEDNPDYERGRGRQSRPWLRGRDGYGYMGNFDWATTNYTGYSLPEPTSDYLYKHIKGVINSVPNGIDWVGDCEPAALAAGNCPDIVGDKEAFGVLIPERERIVLSVLHYRYTKTLLRWPGPLSLNNLKDIMTWYYDIQDQQSDLLLVVNTSGFRRQPTNQAWNGLLDRFEGNSLLMVDFLDWNEWKPGLVWKKLHGPVPYNQVTEVKLKDPNQAADNLRDSFENTVHRQVAKVILDKAKVTLQ